MYKCRLYMLHNYHIMKYIYIKCLDFRGIKIFIQCILSLLSYAWSLKTRDFWKRIWTSMLTWSIYI